MESNEIYAIIPARGGSKGIPNKNIKPFNKHPLIYHCSLAAIESKSFRRIILSTDSEKIASYGEEIGLEVPFLRDKKISNDESKSIDVVFDVIKKCNLKGSICLIQPTSPLVSKNDFIRACELHLKTNKSVLSISEYLFNLGIICKKDDNSNLKFIKKNQGIPRQKTEKTYKLNGAFFLNKISTLKKEKTLAPNGAFPYVMEKYRSIDIDDHVDWKIAEYIQKNINLFKEL